MKSNRFIHFIVASILATSLGTSYAQEPEQESYKSNSPPSNGLIIKKASEKHMGKCDQNITEIIGRLAASENAYKIFYKFKQKGGTEVWSDDITLYRFDDNKWFLICGNGLSGRSGGIVYK